MNKIAEAKEVLKAFQFPIEKPNDIAALTLLALAGIEENMSWREATQQRSTLTKGIMSFLDGKYGRAYKPNTRESIRKLALKPMIHAGIAERNPGRPDIPTNSMHNFYSLTGTALAAIRRFGSAEWTRALNKHLSLQKLSLNVRRTRAHRSGIQVTTPDGKGILLRPGKHNELIAAIVEDFIPYFVPDASVLYLGDASKRDLHVEVALLAEIGISLSTQALLPDVILIDNNRQTLILVEAVVSGGPIHDTG